MGYSLDDAFKLVLVDLSTSSSVASGGGTETFTLQPPKGYIYQIQDWYLYIPAVGTANNHKIEMSYTNLTSVINLGYLDSTFAAAIQINQNLWEADTTVRPTGDQMQFDFMHRCMCVSYDQPLAIKYTNNTDVNQTGNKICEFLVRQYREAN